MTQHGSRPAPTRSFLAEAGPAALWLAAGLAAGLVAAGLWPAGTGVPAVIACMVLAVTVPRIRPAVTNPIEPAATAGGVAPLVAALGGALIHLEDPDAALARMLRLIADAVGSQTALVLTLQDDNATLTLEHPILLEGSVPTEPRSITMGVAESGPIRTAMADGIPVDASSAGGSAAWDELAAAHQIESAAVVPLKSADGPIGALVLSIPGAAVSKADLADLREIMPAAGAIIGVTLLHRRLAGTVARAARTDRFRSDYASVVGHELRTPLTTILGVIRTLARPEMAPENPEARELLKMAAAQGDRLKRLAEDMLAINQVAGDGMPIHPELISLPDLIDRAVGAVPGAGALTTVRIEGPLPPVILDPLHTRRCLVSLLANAVKYGEGSVADHGPGLPPATASHAFDAFTQLRRTEVNAHGGVGLGLSISRGLIESMHGSIRHERTAGGGATFVVRLPFKAHTGRRTGSQVSEARRAIR